MTIELTKTNTTTGETTVIREYSNNDDLVRLNHWARDMSANDRDYDYGMRAK